jgi:hypothetical protein
MTALTCQDIILFFSKVTLLSNFTIYENIKPIGLPSNLFHCCYLSVADSPFYKRSLSTFSHFPKIYPALELSNTEDKEAAVCEDTKKFSGFIEEYIKEHPSEWLWIHRRWKRVGQW